MERPIQSFYDEASNLANEFKDLAVKLSTDESFWTCTETVIKGSPHDDLTLFIFLLVDCFKCYAHSGIELNLDTEKCMFLTLLTARTVGKTDLDCGALTYSSYTISNLQRFLVENIVPTYEKFEQMEGVIETDFIVGNILSKYDAQLDKKYNMMLYRASLMAVQNEDKISTEQSRWLGKLFQMSL